MEVFLMNKKVTITLLSAFLCAGSITNGMESALVPVAKVATKSIASVVGQIAQHKDAITVGGTLGTGAVLATKSILKQKATEKAAKIAAEKAAKIAANGFVKKTAKSALEAVKNVNPYIGCVVGATLVGDAVYQGWGRWRKEEAKPEVKPEEVKRSRLGSVGHYLGSAAKGTYNWVSPSNWFYYLAGKTCRGTVAGTKKGYSVIKSTPSAIVAGTKATCTTIRKKVVGRTVDELKEDIATAESQISEYAKRIIEAERRTAAAKATQVKLQATIDASKKQK